MKDDELNSLASMVFPGSLDLRTPGTYRAQLEAMRDALELTWNATAPDKRAPLAKQIREVIETLATLPKEEGTSELDKHRKRFEQRHAATRRDRATS